MFCQACGKENAEGARFCNICGSRIALPGTPGGPVGHKTVLGMGQAAADAAEASRAKKEGKGPTRASPQSPRGRTMRLGASRSQAPSTGSSEATPAAAPGSFVRSALTTTSLSLTALGIQPSGRTWIVLGVAGALLLATGAVGTYLWLGPRDDGAGAHEPVTDLDRARAGDPRSNQANGVDRGSPAESEVDFVSGGKAAPPPSAPEELKEAKIPPPKSPSETPRKATPPQSRTRRPDRDDATRRRANAGGSKSAPRPSSNRRRASSSDPTSNVSSPPPRAAPAPDPAPSTGGEPGRTSVPDGPVERDVSTDMFAGRVRYVVRRYYAGRARSCFDRATRNAPDLRGRVVVGFRIEGDGRVSSATPLSNTTGDDAVGRCLANQVRTWRLPAPPNGAMELEMPFSN